MTVANFFKGLGAVAAVVATAAVKAQEQNDARAHHLSAEQAEAKKWDDRRLAAHAAIERAVARHGADKSSFGKSTLENKAIDLRREADVNCRNRSEALMGYTEQRVTNFEKYGY